MRWVAALFVGWAQWADLVLTKSAMLTGSAWEMNPITASFMEEGWFIVYKLIIVPVLALLFAWWRPFNYGLYVAAILMLLLLTWNIGTLHNILSTISWAG
jgi:hypothetical protein